MANSGRYGASLVSINPPPPTTGGTQQPPSQYILGGDVGGPNSATFPTSILSLTDGGGLQVLSGGVFSAPGRRNAAIFDLGPTVYAAGGEDQNGGLVTTDETNNPGAPGNPPTTFSSSSAILAVRRTAAATLVVPVGSGTPSLYAYVVGGWDAQHHAVPVEIAKFDGSSHAFTPFATTSTTIPRVYASLVSYANVLYVVGGADLYADGGAGAAEEILAASINTGDGSLGAFNPVNGMRLKQPHVDGAVYLNPGASTVVVLGGFSNVPGFDADLVPTDVIETSVLDGGVNDFQVSNRVLAVPRGGEIGAFVNGTTVVVGGLASDGSGGLTTTDVVETTNPGL